MWKLFLFFFTDAFDVICFKVKPSVSSPPAGNVLKAPRFSGPAVLFQTPSRIMPEVDVTYSDVKFTKSATKGEFF